MPAEVADLLPSMPFQEHVYYGLASGLERPDAPTASTAGAVTMDCVPFPSPGVPARHRATRRLESMNWRGGAPSPWTRWRGVDVLMLQENIMNVTCKLEGEECPHCQAGWALSC